MMKVFRVWLVLGMLLAVGLVGAQDTESVDCGFQYTVVRGDTLAKIAEQCGVTVAGIQAFNNVGTVIYPDQILYLPPPTFEPQVSLAPLGGPIGTPITVSLGGFPPDATLRVGLGSPNETPLADTQLVTNAQGEALVRFTVPTNVDAGGVLVVTAVTTDGRYNATSDTFEVGVIPPTPTPIPAAVTGGAGGADAPINANATTSQLIALDVTRLAPSAAPVEVTAVGVLFDAVNVYMTIPQDNGQNGIAVACGDSVVPVQVPVDLTVAPLTAGVDALLDNTASVYQLDGVVNPLAALGLVIDQIVIVNGEAVINLSGDAFAPVDGCTAALISAQLQATALQYNTVDRASIFLNGQLLIDGLTAAQ